MSTTYRALPIIKVDGEEVKPSISENCLKVVVEESLYHASMFTLWLRNDYKPGMPTSEPWQEQLQELQIGKEVAVGFTPSSTQSAESTSASKELIQGEITSLDIQFTEETQAPIQIRGYDRSHRLHRGRHNRSFQNMTDTDIVRKIAAEASIPLGELEESGEPNDYIFQENQTNIDFLTMRANRIGFHLFIQDGKLNFCRPTVRSVKKLTWLKDLRCFRVRKNSMEQVDEVEVRGWNYKTKSTIVANAGTPEINTQLMSQDKGEVSKIALGNQSSKAFKGIGYSPKKIVVDQTVFKPKEADVMAQTICDELGEKFVVADAVAEGNPEIRPGIQIELEELGPYSGKYYVTDTRHTYCERVYTTEFSVRSFRNGDLLAALTPTQQIAPGQTLLVGIVTDNEDPESLGRVKVKFPTLTEDHTSNWARVVSIGAANSRGFDCLPEIEDEVLVAFEHGDIHRPFILGGIWNGKDSPPNSAEDNVQDGKVRLRTFQTRTGHKLQFVEEDGSEKAGVYIETANDNKVCINDSQKVIEIQTAGQNSVTLDDSGKSISVVTNAGQNISLSDPSSICIASKGTISMNAPSGITSSSAGGVMNNATSLTTHASSTINWTAGVSASIKAPTVSINAPLILLNGVVKINGLTPVLLPV